MHGYFRIQPLGRKQAVPSPVPRAENDVCGLPVAVKHPVRARMGSNRRGRPAGSFAGLLEECCLRARHIVPDVLQFLFELHQWRLGALPFHDAVHHLSTGETVGRVKSPRLHGGEELSIAIRHHFDIELPESGQLVPVFPDRLLQLQHPLLRVHAGQIMRRPAQAVEVRQQPGPFAQQEIAGVGKLQDLLPALEGHAQPCRIRFCHVPVFHAPGRELELVVEYFLPVRVDIQRQDILDIRR